MRESQTEDKIIEAAREVFVEKGMSGARMQEIADRANINKSLLHYYFRSKEKLFNFVFEKLIGKIGKMINKSMNEEICIEDKIKLFTNTYIDILLKNPFLPNFILNELTRNPDSLATKFTNSNIEPIVHIPQLQNQLKNEGYNIDAKDFIINLISLVIFPIASRPLIKRLMFNGDDKEYKKYIIKRKESIVTFIMNALNGYKIADS
jgi:AcrR family transcriptional regulator